MLTFRNNYAEFEGCVFSRPGCVLAEVVRVRIEPLLGDLEKALINVVDELIESKTDEPPFSQN